MCFLALPSLVVYVTGIGTTLAIHRPHVGSGVTLATPQAFELRVWWYVDFVILLLAFELRVRVLVWRFADFAIISLAFELRVRVGESSR